MGSGRKSSLLPRLRAAALHLEQIQSVVVVAVAALRQQNCEIDADVANLLQRGVSDDLHEQIAALRGMAQALSGSHPARSQ